MHLIVCPLHGPGLIPDCIILTFFTARSGWSKEKKKPMTLHPRRKWKYLGLWNGMVFKQFLETDLPESREPISNKSNQCSAAASEQSRATEREQSSTAASEQRSATESELEKGNENSVPYHATMMKRGQDQLSRQNISSSLTAMFYQDQAKK